MKPSLEALLLETPVAGFISPTLRACSQCVEACPALSFEYAREGFRHMIDRITVDVPPLQVDAPLEVTGHAHRVLLHSVQELDIPVDAMPVQKWPLGLANHLSNEVEKVSTSAVPCTLCEDVPSQRLLRRRCVAWSIIGRK